MLKSLVVLVILATVAGGCGAKPAPAGAPAPNDGTAASAQSDEPAVFNPCEHYVYEQLRAGLLARPVRLDDRDRNYLFELDRLCRAHTDPEGTAPAKEPKPQAVPDEKVPACTRAVYKSLRASVLTNPSGLKDEDHWYFHELDRACVQGKTALADKDAQDAAEEKVKRESNRDPVRWLAFLTGVGALAWNLIVSAR